ncbi:MAG: hypothetical protein Q7O66_23125 [Dehalococcoidia bacterium]|nr:hypothetical protein [Dehalococcoidia bacterium]
MPKSDAKSDAKKMKVQVEIEYSAVPLPEEVENVRRAGLILAPDSNTVSVRRGETDCGMPSLILDFEMKTQSETKVVDDIAHTVHICVSGKFYCDLAIRFAK